ncbi:uncharacterized protein LOC129350901 isoform X4 [Amphiprion ocellaris]|uniref:uncharacterized protein LOC129350901 isoform X4 n=1 Tax=Amphiprion ocellaris TaxID=80972 RepID=UPI002410C23B|nr:uncharacterized protein LOC129350901 isoform X4 [Amphiprion ocellaris]
MDLVEEQTQWISDRRRRKPTRWTNGSDRRAAAVWRPDRPGESAHRSPDVIVDLLTSETMDKWPLNGVYQHVSGSAVGRHAIKILAGERRMVFPTGSVSTPGTLTGVIMVSRDMYFTTFKLHKVITFIINRSSSTLRQWDIRITAV